jgi:hypothetical protein
MAIKAFDGKVVTVTGAINAVNDTIEYVPASGKTFYFHSAKIVMTNKPISDKFSRWYRLKVASKDQIVAALKIDTVTKDKAKIGMATSARRTSLVVVQALDLV